MARCLVLLLALSAALLVIPPSTCAVESSAGDEAAALIWQWLDANIGSQERLAAARKAQNLSGPDIGRETTVSATNAILFKEQLNLLYEIRKAKNLEIAKQYMLVHTLMTLEQAEYTRSHLAADDPRQPDVAQQIDTARKLLAAIGYKPPVVEKDVVQPAAK